MTGRTPSNAPGEVGATTDRILRAACEVIAEVGFEHVRMRMVAERAAVSTALLHYHFVDRETLFRGAMRYSFRSTGAGPAPEHSSAAEALLFLVRGSLPSDGELTQDWRLWPELWARGQRDPHLRDLAFEMYAVAEREMRDVIRAGIAAGEFADTAADALGQLVLSLCDGHGVRVMLGAQTAESAVDAVWAVIADRLGADPRLPARSRG